MEDEPSIGRVFTPTEWAMWLIEEVGAFQAWIDGATICDPNFGGGAFVLSLFELASRRGVHVTAGMISNVFGCEIRSSDKPELLGRALADYQVALIEDNFTSGDVLDPSFDRKFDVLVGNPPWSNFSALPSSLRGLWAEKYLEHGLVKSRKDVLLGASRADLATLIIKKLIDRNMRAGGSASFFLPLSIFFNSGSNDLFRPYPGSPHDYAINEIWDFVDDRIFPGITTRYGAARLTKSSNQEWPVSTHVREGGGWALTASTCSDGRQGFWQRHDSETGRPVQNPQIVVSPGQQPRQGLNTCGANDILTFTREGSLYRNGVGDLVELEEELVHPLVDKSLFGSRKAEQRFVLVPHSNPDGRPLTQRQLLSYPKALNFLKSRKSELECRKGTMLRSHIRRGEWWALLGVGPYSYSAWKVIWEALGKSAFKPKVVSGRWQGNQALHAYCPCETRDDADRLVDALMDPSIEAYLLASAMGGTLNWAQPGRIGKILSIEPSQQSLFA